MGEIQFIKVFSHDPVIVKLQGKLYVYNSRYTSWTPEDIQSVQVEKRQGWKNKYITISSSKIASGSDNISKVVTSKGLLIFRYTTGSHKHTYYTLYFIAEPLNGVNDKVTLQDGYLEIENAKFVGVFDGRKNIDAVLEDVRVQEMIEQWKLSYNAKVSQYDDESIKLIAWVMLNER